MLDAIKDGWDKCFVKGHDFSRADQAGKDWPSGPAGSFFDDHSQQPFGASHGDTA
jgi:hypothetical protein